MKDPYSSLCDPNWKKASPVVKPDTIHTVLSLANSRYWPIHQLDMKNAFLYDDILLTASSSTFLQWVVTSLHGEFAMMNLCSLNYFLGIFVQRSSAGADGDPISDPTLYQSLAGSLKNLTFTRPNISYAVQKVCVYMHDPREPHLAALKRILRYVCGTIDHVLLLHISSISHLTAYTDADWARCPVTHRSTLGYCVFLSDNVLSWSAKRQVTLSRSSVEAEYGGVANVFNTSTKHIEIDIHFVRDYVASGEVRVLHVPSRFQYADIFTKAWDNYCLTTHGLRDMSICFMVLIVASLASLNQKCDCIEAQRCLDPVASTSPPT
ncbi:ribonuclease H-like domain-containing protein [Tanacetum coccineum]|uniref:Ribonuclease H-like domain-containing protein n=1 Tax=Tanacetum coccineum TaxID=301880 RepID=A0ABQ5ISZ5_9ASTR